MRAEFLKVVTLINVVLWDVMLSVLADIVAYSRKCS